MNEMFPKILMVAAGGALGAVVRFILGILFGKFLSPFPFSTFFINVTGSFLIGLLAVVFTEKLPLHENLKIFLTVGFLGAYTTFSTFELETLELLREKHALTAFLYISLSFAAGLIGVFSGVWLAKKF